MLIATIPNVDRIDVPSRVREAAEGREIYVSIKDVPFEASSWVACCHAWPHDDGAAYSQTLFLTLAVEADHEIGDLEQPAGTHIRAGSFFVIAAETTHWLAPIQGAGIDLPFISLQWPLHRDNARAAAREIIDHLHGQWLETTDRRYLNWRPT